MLAVVLLGACKEKPKQAPKPTEKPFVTQTKKNLYKWIDENAINPEDFKVSNLKVVWATDSLCVINFRAIGENGFGGHVKNEFQYFNIILYGRTYEYANPKRSGNGIVEDGQVSWVKRYILECQKDETLTRLDKDTTKAGKIFTNAYLEGEGFKNSNYISNN